MFSIYDGPDARCILLSKRSSLVAGLQDALEQNEAELTAVQDYAALENALAADPGINFVMIDLDSRASVNAQIPSLQRLRRLYRDRPTILLSADFTTNEFGTHRKMLGDVSLRVPVLHTSLEIALLQAPVNNLEWCAHLDATSSGAAKVAAE